MKTSQLLLISLFALAACKKDKTTQPASPVSRCFVGISADYTIQNYGNGPTDIAYTYNDTICFTQYNKDSIQYEGYTFTRAYDSLQTERYINMNNYPQGTWFIDLFGTDSVHYELWDVGAIVYAQKFSGREI
ncbi:MAG: hypothetical protein U0T75_01510 [Chitinophagales bacterium]